MKKDDILFEMVRVVWMDAEEEGETGWNDFKTIKKYAKKPCPEMHSVGYVVFRNEHHISLVSSLSIDKKHSSTCEKIPIAFVKEIITLYPKKKIKEK
tara:strand:+ start:150 stop:440 length:291 start_codon:yes stop_codon:yes gene_type:complete